MEVPNEIPGKKPKRLTSVVWNHFERVRKADSCYAVCVHCKKKLSGSSNSGTTHLRNHLVRCLKRSNYDVSQILAAKRKRKETSVTIASVNHDEMQAKDDSLIPIAYKFEREPKKEEAINLGSVRFDQQRSRVDLARMIILHDYPLEMVEHVGFKMFVKNLQPSFEIVSNAIEIEVISIHEKEREKIYKMLRNFQGRFSISVGTWASPENTQYLCLKASYIDNDWKLQSKILNFVTLDSSQTGNMLSEIVMKCLMDWEVDCKVLSMTHDDCFSCDDFDLRTKDRSKPFLQNGQLFDMRCSVHLVKCLAQEALRAIRDVAQKIRDSIMHVKSSETNQKKFSEVSHQVGIKELKNLFLDFPTRWDSTYRMLETALEYKEAFAVLKDHDPTYTVAFSESEWERAVSLTSCVKLLVEITIVFSGNKGSTANLYFPEMCDVNVQLINWCKAKDEFVGSFAKKMKTKFDEYWNKCSLVLAIAAILDPRFKMKLVEYYFPQIYEADAANQIKAVYNRISELFDEYATGQNSLDSESSVSGSNVPGSSNGTRDQLRGFDKFLHETGHSRSEKSDLEKYLEEPVFPRNHDFNILNWWKVHTSRYPVLSIMARDILGLSVSTLDPELAFSTGGRVLDHHLSSLHPDTRQALICGRDWLRMESEEINPAPSYAALPHSEC